MALSQASASGTVRLVSSDLTALPSVDLEPLSTATTVPGCAARCGDTYTFKATTESTGGAFALLEASIPNSYGKSCQRGI